MKSLNMCLVRGMTILVLLFTAATAAAAGEMDASTTSWDIPSQSLKSALEIYQQVSGLNLAYSDNLVKGKTTQGVQGNHTREQALEKVLEGTDLTYKVTSKGTVILKVRNSGAALQKTVPAQEENSPAYETDKAEESELEQTSIETITVTVNKIEEDLQDVPQNIMVIDEEIIKEKGITDIPDVIDEIPNMSYMPGLTPGPTNSVNFRGLTPSLFTNNFPVVTYIDGVAYSNSGGFNASLVNVERIEVLRGPQGTLYGKDAIGAVIKIVTKEPDNEWHGNIGAEYGSYNDMEGSFNVSGPLVQEKLYIGLNARYQQDDGWITNDYTGNDEENKTERKNLGALLLYKPTDRFSAKFILSNDSYEYHGYSGYALPGGTNASEFSRDDAEHVSVDKDTFGENDSLSQSLYLKYEFDSMTLTSTTTHRDSDSESVRDSDYQANNAKDGLNTFTTENTETWTEELRASSNNTEGFRWVAGAYFEIEDVETGPTGIQAKLSETIYDYLWDTETESQTLALFGQTMIPLGDSFELTLGLRYQRIDKEMDLDEYIRPVGGSSEPVFSLHPDESWTAFLPKAALSYRLSDNWTTYASVAQGYMPGGFTTLASSGSAEDNTFDPQKSTNYEIGVKGKSNRARFAAAIFYMDIEDIHFSRQENDTWVCDNADSAHSLGAELELTYFLTDSLELTAAFGIIEAEYDDYDNGQVVWDGESISGTPSYSGQIGAAYYHPNGFYARGDVRLQGEVPYYDSADAEFAELDDYITADVKVGYRFKGFDVYAYCNNLTDEEYITYFLTGAKALAIYDDPRTFGIGIRYSF